MTAKKAVVRRAAGAALALVLALVVVGSVAAATRRDRTPPTTPTNLRVTSVSHKSVTLAWDPSTDRSSFSYSVNVNGLSWTVPQTQTTFTVNSLSAGQTYTFYVTAVDTALNTSGRSNTVTATTLADTTPPTTPALSGAVKGPSQVMLSWTRSTDDLAWFVGYRIFANGALVTEHVNWYAETRVVLRHLTPATSYTFTVQAHDFSGNASTSNAVTLTTEATSDVTPPSVPTNVRIVESNGGCEFWVGWTQSTDDTDPQYAIEYEIYVNGVLSPLAVGGGIDRDFVYGTASENTFTVKAVDRAGNTSEASNAATDVC
jgi:fibronectin type 3 domain-containing protein